MILTIAEMTRLEEQAFSMGLTAEKLMDRAGSEIVRSIEQFFPTPGSCIVFAGKGNNAGDALVAAKHLLDRGWQVNVRLSTYEQELGMLPRKKHREIRDLLSPPITFPCRRPLLVLDGLVGVGATGELRDGIKDAACEINRLRQQQSAYVLAVDIPTGLIGENQQPDSNCVEASFTLAIGFAKDVLVADGASKFVGRLIVLPLPQLDKVAEKMSSKAILTTGSNLSPLLPRRSFGTHKGHLGRIGVVAGSRGTIGAAVLASSGAVHAGGGLITIYAREESFALTAATAAPEVMVKPVRSYLEVLEEKLDVLAIGPGLGLAHAEEVLSLIEAAPWPAVVDADALNALADDLSVLARCVGQRLLTPHPGEMARLSEGEDLTRSELTEWFTLQYPVTLLLKGSRTLVSEKGRRPAYNGPGNPGMSSGGMGDVLTGVCAALMGRGLNPYDAGRMGAWVCGRAAEIAIFGGPESEETLSATHLFRYLGQAFEELRSGVY